jgi:hypothetical protein
MSITHMKSTVSSFHNYLRREVDTAGRRYERATEQIFALTEKSTVEADPKLLKATQALDESTRLYLGALRRLAHFSAHQARRHARVSPSRTPC